MRDKGLDPNAAAELAELEAALRGDEAADGALVTLVADVRADRCEADPAFLAALEQRVADGFPAAHSAGRARVRAWLRSNARTAMPIGAAAIAATLIAFTLVAGPDRPGTALERPAQSGSAATDAESDGGAPGAESSSGADASPSSEAEAPAEIAPTLPSPPGTTGRESLKADRKVERSASMTLTAPRGRLEQTSDRIIATTTRLGGYVANSSLSVRGNSGSATFRLRVPTGSLPAALKALSSLGHVRSLEQSEQDITGTYDAATAAVEDARAERRGLLSALRRATDEDQISRIKERLRQNRMRLAAADAQLREARTRSQRATIDVYLTTAATAEAAPREQGFGLGAAWAAALRVLSASAGVLLIAIAALIPLGAVTLVALAATRRTRRRRRESALDGSGPGAAAGSH